MQSRGLPGVNALGKAQGVGVGGSCRGELPVAGDVLVGTLVDRVNGPCVATGQEAGEETCEAKGGQLEEAAGGARRRQGRHEHSSNRCMTRWRVRGGIRADNATFGGFGCS
jgi:hypothetical protein